MVVKTIKSHYYTKNTVSFCIDNDCPGEGTLISKMIKLKAMYVILMYDVNEKRVSKMLKLCRKYLNWIQNSVFEGEISEVMLKDLKIHALKIINPETDSLIIFKTRQEKWLDKEIIGLERAETDNFI